MAPTSEMSMWTEERVPIEPKVIKLPNFPEPLTLREQAAIAAMQGVMNFFGSIDYNRDTIAKLAVEQADALIEELKKK